MRSTVTLDPDVDQQLRARMRERGTGFKETLNETLRRGLREDSAPLPYQPPRFRSGVHSAVNLDKALDVVAELEDDEFSRRVELGK